MNRENTISEHAITRQNASEAQHAELTIAEHGRRLTKKLLDGLGRTARLQLHGPYTVDRRVPVVSFSLEGYDPRELATTLDGAYGVQVRAGFHCAPLMHRALGTDATGGAVRLSPGPFTTERDVDDALEAIEQIAATPMLR